MNIDHGQLDHVGGAALNGSVDGIAFSATAHRCEGVFETLNLITRMLLHKYINQSAPQYA